MSKNIFLLLKYLMSECIAQVLYQMSLTDVHICKERNNTPNTCYNNLLSYNTFKHVIELIL